MPQRPYLVFSNNHYYHIFNRGVERRVIFPSPKYYSRFIQLIKYYRYLSLPISYSQFLTLNYEKQEGLLQDIAKTPTQVDILSYCLMPNHFHFLLRQKADKGIPRFISNLTNSYVRYFNTKNQRVGPLFQGVFKAVHVESEEHLFHLSRYIHLNPVVSSILNKEELFDYPWSSISEYLNISKFGFIDKNTILSQFEENSYQKFLLDYVDYAKELDRIKHLTLDL